MKAGQEGIGLKHLAEELREYCWSCIRGDSSANDGIIKRSGAGKVKLLSVRQLWLQERSAEGIMKHQKVPRAENCSDALTHHFTRFEADVHFVAMGCRRSERSIEVRETQRAVSPEGGSGGAAAVFTSFCGGSGGQNIERFHIV